jgi:hypothetical protein
MTEPMNAASVVATAMQGVRARIAWLSEGQVGGEELESLLACEGELEGWLTEWGPRLDKFEIHPKPDDII